ncbi:MAG: hypothetical protein IPH62_06135 [Ignavibacteriae bacterium]|nr:hypothetical protein [Ignavibacteriota bacterium]
MTSIIARIVLFFSILLLLTFLSCSEDPSSPKEEKPKDAVTVGVNGGTVEKGDFKITIPPGAFDNDYNISVSEVEDDGAFGENSSTPIYKISGIPQTYSEPLLLSVKKNDSSTDEQLLAVGYYYWYTDNVTYSFFESYDSNGYINSKLPLLDNEFGNKYISKIAEKTDVEFYVRHAKDYHTLNSNENHFKIYYPPNWDTTRVIEFGNYLEEAYQKIYDLGFRYDARTNWPVEITFLKQVADGLTSNSWFGNNYGYINFSGNLLNQMSNAHVTAAHEFFHLVQFLYDQRNGIKKSAYPSNFHWVNEACSAWLEEKFSDEINYIPEVWKENKLSPLEGLQTLPNTSNDQIISHGYGLSALIKYLVSKFGESILIDIYSDLKNGKHPVDAVCRTEENRIGEFEYPVEWWEDFLKEYILGNVYSDISLSELTDKFKTGNFKILTNTDTLKTFTNKYQDLSGKLFTVSLNYPEIDPSAQIIFKVSGANKKYLTLFKYNDKVLEYLATDYDKIVVDDIKTLTQNGWNFLALVSNNRYSQPYTAQHEITLDVKIEKNKPNNNLSDFNTCGFGLDLEAIIKTTDENGNSESTKSLSFNWYIYNAKGSFSGNTFTGSFNERSGEFIGSITATLNESLTQVTNFTYKFEYTPSSDNKSIYLVSGTDIPVTLLDDNEIRCGMYWDNNICSHLTKVYFKNEYNYNGKPITEELIDPSCDDYSNIYISFKKE